jgi:hypothetical protein
MMTYDTNVDRGGGGVPGSGLRTHSIMQQGGPPMDGPIQLLDKKNDLNSFLRHVQMRLKYSLASGKLKLKELSIVYFQVITNYLHYV